MQSGFFPGGFVYVERNTPSIRAYNNKDPEGFGIGTLLPDGEGKGELNRTRNLL